MNRLIINTANDDLCLVLNSGAKLSLLVVSEKIKHNEALIPTIDKLLKEQNLSLKDIDELGVVVGPGSFTGIRVGIATVKSFRDALGIKAVGINNLDLLYALAKKQGFKNDVVAIKGSRDSYFVARLINGLLYRYDHNLTESELKQIAKDNKVAMFSPDEKVDCFVVKYDAGVIDELTAESNDYSLIPVYYQLSQAEREKLNKLDIELKKCKISDFKVLSDIEKRNISYNVINDELFRSMLKDNNHVAFVAKIGDESVGFVLAEISDEINITSIAVDKNFRNLGIATKLIDKLKSHAKRNKIYTLSLEVKKQNVSAYLLYEKLGFTVRRIRKKYYDDGDDCFEMSLKLD